MIQKNLSILSALQIDAGRARNCRCTPDATAETVTAIEAAGGSRGYVVLNPGAAWPNKRWPPDRFGALAAALRDRTGLRSLVTWGPSERELADAVVHASSAAPRPPAPATSVSDLAVLMRDAALVVSGDTGPLHIAAAMGTPLVGLYGPTWPERNGPWDPSDDVISRAERVRVPSQAPVPARRAVHQRDHARRSGRGCDERRRRSWRHVTHLRQAR